MVPVVKNLARFVKKNIWVKFKSCTISYTRKNDDKTLASEDLIQPIFLAKTPIFQVKIWVVQQIFIALKLSLSTKNFYFSTKVSIFEQTVKFSKQKIRFFNNLFIAEYEFRMYRSVQFVNKLVYSTFVFQKP